MTVPSLRLPAPRPLRRARPRPRSGLYRIGQVARYELRWDLRKYWLYASAIGLVVVAFLAVVLSSIVALGIESALPKEYTVEVHETGLPSGTSWGLSLSSNSLFSSNPSRSTTGSTLSFDLSNGSYEYSIGSISGNTTQLAASPPSGIVTVNGTGANLTVNFSPIPSGQVSFAQAEAIAITAANGVGGNWTPLFAAGVDYTAPAQNTSTPNNGICRLGGGSGSWPLVKAWNGNYSNGLSTAWEFNLWQQNTSSEDVVTVQGGTATNVGWLNTTCLSSSGSVLTPEFPTVKVNSTQAATLLLPDDSAYLKANPQSSSLFQLSVANNVARWTVVFTTCDPEGGGPSTGSAFSGLVNAVTGQLGSTSSTSVNCPGTPTPSPSSLPRSGPIAWAAPPLLSIPFIGTASKVLGQLESENLRQGIWQDALLLVGGFGLSFLTLIIGGVSASESISREKEMGTLGALFQQPVGRGEIFLGKFLEKFLLLLVLSTIFVVAALVVAWNTDGPQAGVLYAPVYVLYLTLVFSFFASFALVLSAYFRRSRNVSGLLWGEEFLALFALFYLGAIKFPQLPLAYFVPGASVWLPLPALRVFLANPAGTAAVSPLPQVLSNAITVLSWGTVPSLSFLVLSTIGLVADISLFLLIGVRMLRQMEVKT